MKKKLCNLCGERKPLKGGLCSGCRKIVRTIQEIRQERRKGARS